MPATDGGGPITFVPGGLIYQGDRFSRQALRIRYFGNRKAHLTVEEAGDLYIGGMRQRSARQDDAVGNWDQQVMRGQGVHVDAYGNAVMLPNYEPGQRYQAQNGSIYTQGTDGYWRDRNGYFLTPR
jgi:hypothetical protein